MGNVLVIDDDPNIRELCSVLLDRQGYTPIVAADGRQGLVALAESLVDLAIVDAMMPHLDGIEFCRLARRYHPDLPLLMLTAKGQLGDKAKGFAAGADDYLVKPFDGAELLMRVKALLRRYRKIVEQTAQAGRLALDTASHVATLDGGHVDLPLKEFELLFLLAGHKGRTLTREFILDAVWGCGFEGTGRTLDVHINRLRDRFG
ncbi:MAG: response regulator transcription factor, partial [Bifidobacteriaceae bacterium]|nr:response regulator transcription factor [Bifidobacteriaceae bacterium]